MNVLPVAAPGKGVAVSRVMQRWPSSAILYVGDDETDEEVFRLDDSALITVRIGNRAGSRAQFFLDSQTEVDGVMRALLN